jgi:mannose-6-phosphate isomerase-like protein (cupin superfamily)
MALVIDKDELPYGGSAHKFEGGRYGGSVSVSFFLVDARPGSGPVLHTHPYEEIIVVQEARASFTVGGATIEATSGQIVVVPAGISTTDPATSVSSRARRAPTHYADRLGAA